MIKDFYFSTAQANIKYANRDDVALIFSDKPFLASGVFTKNRVKAAPVIYCKDLLEKRRYFRALLINSGNANACTGKDGLKNCRTISEELAKSLNIDKDEVLLASTGVIGVQLPAQKIISTFDDLKKQLSPHNLEKVAKAIMTTDSYQKISLYNGEDFNIAGIAKGAGMINPNMATMLSFIFTDAELEEKVSSKILKKVTEKTFNSICVDGDTSTNDSLFLLSSQSKSGVKKEYFKEKFTDICLNLAKLIVKDGEGATKLIKISINNGKSIGQCKLIGETIAKSPLVKTAFFGGDPNWGRIICAVGYSNADIDPEKIDIYFDKMKIVDNGVEAPNFSEKEAAQYLKNSSDISLSIDLKIGRKNWEYYTCDLSYEYVKINADYRT